jgi:ATP-dependent Lon protease
MPSRNKKDLEEVPQEAQKQLQFIFIDDVNDAVKVAIQPSDAP